MMWTPPSTPSRGFAALRYRTRTRSVRGYRRSWLLPRRLDQAAAPPDLPTEKAGVARGVVQSETDRMRAVGGDFLDALTRLLWSCIGPTLLGICRKDAEPNAHKS